MSKTLTKTKHVLVRCWKEFSENSSINALRYPFNGQLPKIEQFWWRKSIVSFLVAYCFVIVTLYFKWVMNPVVVTYTRTMHPLWELPFPAVTICPMTKVRVEEVNLTDVLVRVRRGETFDEYESMKLYTLSQVCPFMWMWYKQKTPANKTSSQVLQNMSLSINDLFLNCYWKNIKWPCYEILAPTMTENGVCYTFNQISSDQLLRKENINLESVVTNSWLPSDWNMETGYGDNAGVDSYPFRPLAKGYHSGLAIVLKTRQMDTEYLCEGPNKGFKVSIHPPDEYWTMSNRFFRLPFQQALLLTVDPKLTTISQDLKKHHHTRRQCYFNDERYLKFFKIYNTNNCLFECFANLTDSFCHCDQITRLRGLNTTVCVGELKDCPEIILHKQERSHQSLNGNEEWIGPCECLPACAYVTYDVEVSRTPFNPHKLARALFDTSDFYTHSHDYALLAVGIKSKWMLPMKRCELMDYGDLMAQIGCLFGLMMGASVVSLVEILYFCLVRPLVQILKKSDTARPAIPWVK
ncbi:pickpocket protein 28-like [Armigeres subalbatus]|uniref:pickpocket protein 28-like n=1 Tax=Armigeres subalbatus TaxID=124917 RepID=UPI002ED4F7D7